MEGAGQRSGGVHLEMNVSWLRYLVTFRMRRNRSSRARRILLSVATLSLFASVCVADSLSRSEERHARAEIEHCRPNLAVVERIEFHERIVTVSGYTENVNAAANFAENIKAHPLFTRPETTIRLREGSTRVYEYALRFSVRTEEQHR